jgi:hypothetical protein
MIGQAVMRRFDRGKTAPFRFTPAAMRDISYKKRIKTHNNCG